MTAANAVALVHRDVEQDEMRVDINYVIEASLTVAETSGNTSLI